MTERPSQQKEFFNSLVESGLDFIETSINELEAKNLKYSVIHFVSGIEILLKARLLQEHWTLIFSNTNFSFDALKSGDAHTVNMDEAIKCIEEVIQTKIPDDAKTIFKELQKHRNRNIHFYPKNRDDNQSDIAAEQLRAWCFVSEPVGHGDRLK